MVQTIDRRNVQGLIFQSYNYPLARYFLFQFGDTAGARRFLAEWAPLITSAAQDPAAKAEPLINIALSWPGLNKTGALERKADVPASEAFPWDFREPPDADAMGDHGGCAPSNWWNRRFRSEDVDLLFYLNCQSEAALATYSDKIRASARKNNIKELIPTRDGKEALTGGVPNKGIVHFGYRDGISQPAINWDDAPNRPDLIDFRNFLLGYWCKTAESFPRAAPWSDLARDGCYVVMRWLYQDVAKFNKFLRVESARLWPDMAPADAQELLAAKLMGRWRNGTPLILSPDKPDDALALNNDFSYAGDPNGAICPFSSHIRIAHRRDDELTFANQQMFESGGPRILRRGSSYGTTLTGEEDDGEDRGLIGMFLCSNINMQFYSIMRWLNKTDFNAKVTDVRGQDPLFGNRHVRGCSNTFQFEAAGKNAKVDGLQEFIRTQGTLMLLLPSLAMLQRFSENNA
jgi:hypothetical protein